MEKRGQVTIFIILGLILLLSIGIATYLYNRQATVKFENAPQLTSFDPQAVTQYVNTCLQKIGTEGIYLIAAQGGYLNPKGDYTYGEDGDSLPQHYYLDTGPTSYLVDDNSSFIRPISDLSILLNRYIVVNLPDCLNFTDLERQGFTVLSPQIDWQANGFNFSAAELNYSADPVRVSTVARLQNSDVVITASYPLTFKSGDQTFSVNAFSTTVPLRLALLHKIASRLTAEIAETQRNQSVYKFAEHCTEYATPDKTINMYSTQNQYALDYAVQIVDTSPTQAGKAPLRFNFAVRNAKLFGNCIG